MKRFLAPAFLALCALAATAQEPTAVEHDDEWKADLKAAQDFADMLERAGEPDITQAILVWVPSDRSTSPSLARDYADIGGIAGWLLPRQDTRDKSVRVYFEDGILRSLVGITRGRELVPIELRPAEPERISDWVVDGVYFRREPRWTESDAWRIAHWAAWHARLKQEDKAAAAWKAARKRFLDLPVRNPSPFQGLTLAAARAMAAGCGNEAELLQACERIEAITREPLEAETAAAVSALRDQQEAKIATLRGLGKDEAAQIHATLLQERLKAAQKREAARQQQAAREEWINSYTRTRTEVLPLPRSFQVEYWIHQLPDWSSEILMSDRPGRFIDSISQKGTDPCQEIFALGDDTLPTLVAGACEPWETETFFDGKALTIGDVCAFLIEQITGDAPLPHAEGDFFPGRHLAPAARKEAIEAWWNELKPLSAEDRWLVLWKRGSRRAVPALIRIDARKHLPALVERADRARGRSRCIERGQLVEALRTLPEGQLEDMEESAAAECHEVIREALTK